MMHLQGAPMRRPFTDWMADVDRLLVKHVGLDSGSMEDYPWHAEFDCGISPREAVDTFIEENDLA
jgi:hypothetical protein